MCYMPNSMFIILDYSSRFISEIKGKHSKMLSSLFFLRLVFPILFLLWITKNYISQASLPCDIWEDVANGRHLWNNRGWEKKRGYFSSLSLKEQLLLLGSSSQPMALSPRSQLYQAMSMALAPRGLQGPWKHRLPTALPAVGEGAPCCQSLTSLVGPFSALASFE